MDKGKRRKRGKHALSLLDLGSSKEVRILNVILEAGGAAKTTLILEKGREIDACRQTIVRLLSRLEEKGWLSNRRGEPDDRRASIWELTPEALEALGVFSNDGIHRILSDIEKGLSNPNLKPDDKAKLIKLNLPAFEKILASAALIPIRLALEEPKYANALESWKMFFTLLVERESLAILSFLHKHRELALKAFPPIERVEV